MRYIIGDIHANIEELRKLIGVLSLAALDQLVFLGDYIDRLPHTIETLEFLETLDAAQPCVFLKGNHEFFWDRYLNYGETFRKGFFYASGAREALEEFTPDPTALIERGDVPALKKFLAPYLALIAKTEDFFICGDYVATHAGFLPNQLDDSEPRFTEANYFVRPDKLDLDKRYLGLYTVVAGHTHLNVEPFVRSGYINIDLGSGYGRFLGALCVESREVIRSDGKVFSLPKL